VSIQDQGRRGFFKRFAGEAIAWLEELSGIRHYKLADLWDVSEESLSTLEPLISPGVDILLESGKVFCRTPANASLEFLFDADEENLFVFNRFNGSNSVGRIASELSISMKWSPEQSYAHVRGLFLKLIRLRVCIPKNTINAVSALAPGCHREDVEAL
jgi:hypothetical protein